MFNDFYVLIGVLMLSPLMIVLFWNRGVILRRGEASIQMQLHERKKLIRIRERISKQINENDNNDEIIDAAFMSKDSLQSFLEQEIEDSSERNILFSLHLKATMMKVSDPIIFGHAVKVFFK